MGGSGNWRGWKRERASGRLWQANAREREGGREAERATWAAAAASATLAEAEAVGDDVSSQ